MKNYELVIEELSKKLKKARSQVKRLQESEAKRKTVEEALRKSEKRYRAVVEDQTELIVRCLPDYTRTFVNDAYCRYFNKTKEELLGKSYFPFMPKNEIKMVIEKTQSMTPENPVISYEHRLKLSNGEFRWQHWIKRGIFDKNGKLVETQSIGRDITERKLAERSLIASEKILKNQKLVLEQKNIALREILEQLGIEKKQIKDQMMDNISHIFLPLLEKIKLEGNNIVKQYIDLLKKSIEGMMTSYNFGQKISQSSLKLTSKEIIICNMIRTDLTSKEIAKLLHNSPETIEAHRNNIRHKLNIANKKINLSTYLKNIGL